MKKALLIIASGILVFICGFLYFNNSLSISKAEEAELINLNKKLVKEGFDVNSFCSNSTTTFNVDNETVKSLNKICKLKVKTPDFYPIKYIEPRDVVDFYLHLESQNIDASKLCSSSLEMEKYNKDTHGQFKNKLQFICDDLKTEKEFKEIFSKNKDYKLFLQCAKDYAAQIEDIKSEAGIFAKFYFENESFTEFKVQYERFVKYPRSMRIMEPCDDKAEESYWEMISNSNNKEDIEFCIEVLTTCQNDGSCPKNHESLLKKCSTKSM